MLPAVPAVTRAATRAPSRLATGAAYRPASARQHGDRLDAGGFAGGSRCQARIYGGIHFDSGNSAGQALGRMAGIQAFAKARSLWQGGTQGEKMKWLIIGIYVFSFTCIHRRGKLCLPLRQQLFTQSTLFAPLNVFIYLFSRSAATAFVAPDEVPGIGRLRENWQAIRAEAESLRALASDGAPPSLKNGVAGFYLKWYDSALPAARHLCPRTSALLQSIPAIKLATFVEMRPGARLERHRDPYAGWLRYHLSLSTPNDEACFIEVDGQRYAWRDGHAMMFDETYVHWAANGCDTSRLILLCDIERPMRFRWAQAVNHFFGRMLSAAMTPPSGTTGQKGFGAVLFGLPRSIGRYRRRLMSWSMASYRITVAALIAGFAVLLALH